MGYRYLNMSELVEQRLLEHDPGINLSNSVSCFQSQIPESLYWRTRGRGKPPPREGSELQGMDP